MPTQCGGAQRLLDASVRRSMLVRRLRTRAITASVSRFARSRYLQGPAASAATGAVPTSSGHGTRTGVNGVEVGCDGTHMVCNWT